MLRINKKLKNLQKSRNHHCLKIFKNLKNLQKSEKLNSKEDRRLAGFLDTFSIKMKIKKKMIEILWSVMGGLIFSMLPQLFITGRSGAGTFSIERWFIWWRWTYLLFGTS